MKIVIDIEANALENPTEIWVIVCKDIDTGERYIFREVTKDEQQKKAFLDLLGKADLLVGHNLIEYDLPVLHALLSSPDPGSLVSKSLDTLILSRLVDYSIDGGHSIDAYGKKFGIEKGKFWDWSKYTQEMEDYCVRDVDICERIYRKYLSIIDDPAWQSAIDLEQRFQGLVNDLHDNGFAFNRNRAEKLLSKVTEELADLDKDILGAFPPKEVLIREFTPKLTKFGTISRTSVPRSLHHNIHLYKAGEQYRHTSLVDFNPASHKQVIAVLNEAGWQPTDKTQTHIDTEREISRLKYTREENKDVAVPKQELLAALTDKLNVLKTSGWKINENNLSTLPSSAPKPSRLLAKRILLESRRRTLTEWLGLVSNEDGRIHGRFYGIGAWTHRMAHQKPNTANIPSEFREDGSVKLLGKEMRTLWQAPRQRLLVGVDAEGIQLRIFAHYIQDEEFTHALVAGKKSEKTDPHSLNQRIIGDLCKTRLASKRFIFALLLGAGLGKLAQILGCSTAEVETALNRLLERYEGFARLKQTIIPEDAKKGYFIGLDNRSVPIPGATVSERKHLAMSGYLQNGEAVVLKRAAIIFHEDFSKEGWPVEMVIRFVNMVHDEYITEVPNDMKIALRVAEIKADAIRKAGEFYKLRCPLAGSYYSEDRKDYTIGTNWYVTH